MEITIVICSSAVLIVAIICWAILKDSANYASALEHQRKLEELTQPPRRG